MQSKSFVNGHSRTFEALKSNELSSPHFQIVHINQISNASEDNDKCVLLNHQIPNITYSGGGTNTYSAILKAKVY